MYIGLDNENNRVTADEAKHGEVYRCPICEERLELRQGQVRRHHFAHWKNRSCIDTWSSDMSEWHINWQAKFPKECQEVVVELDGKKHRADVLIEERKLVVEFQHSPIKAKEFAERNEFYIRCGYHVIWLFDMSDGFKNGHFVPSDDEDYYSWKHAWGTFYTNNYERVNYSGNTSFSPDIDRQECIQGYQFQKRVLYEGIMVFFQNEERIEKLMFYDIENKSVVLSSQLKSNPFYWSTSTFVLFLRRIYKTKTMNAPLCTKCKVKMVLREYSGGGFLWGCKNFLAKNIDCRERRDLGSMPFEVTWDNMCPFCEERLVGSLYRVRCENCGFEIEINSQ